jgi:hypothetical protein
VPVARRTLIPSAGGAFDTTITSTVGRQVGQISTFNVDVPAGKTDIDVNFHTPDASADNKFTYFLLDPTNKVVAQASAPTTVAGVPVNNVTLVAPNPAAGRWEIDVELNLTTSGKEFTQVVNGTVAYNQAAPPAATAADVVLGRLTNN